MHTVMSFLGCIGTLMKGSGLQELLASAYSGVESMLNGKAWTKALRGYRMVVTALLEEFVVFGNTHVDQLEAVLTKRIPNRPSLGGLLCHPCDHSPYVCAC